MVIADIVVVLALAVGLLWLWRVWWPRQHALLTAPPPAAARGWDRVARVGADLLDPVSAGISPMRALVGKRGHRFVQVRWRVATLILGGPRTGKTKGVLIPNVMAWLGSVIATSTRHDVLDACAAVRCHRGTVWLFDPLGAVRRLPDGVRRLYWSPLRGCRVWDVASCRGKALTLDAGEGVENADHWRRRGGQLLAALLHAAALAELPMSRVIAWVRAGSHLAALQLLQEHGASGPAELLEGIVQTCPPKELGSIWSAIAGILSPFDSSAVLACADASSGCDFDADTFLAGANSLFLVAPSDASWDLAPLVVGLIEEIRVAALRITDGADDGALSVPLLLALDEAANIAPVPSLPQIAAEGGGRNITLIVVLQDLTAADRRWGRDFSRALLTLCGAKLVLPGLADDELLQSLSRLCGTRWVDRGSRSKHRHRQHWALSYIWPFWPAWTTSSTRQVTPHEEPVFSGQRIREMPRGTALAILENLPARMVRIGDFDEVQPFASWACLPAPAPPSCPVVAPDVGSVVATRPLPGRRSNGRSNPVVIDDAVWRDVWTP